MIRFPIKKDLDSSLLAARKMAMEKKEPVLLIGGQGKAVLHINEHGDVEEVNSRPLKVKMRIFAA